MSPLFSYIWKNSTADQIKILIIVVFSFPFYYISLDIPKHIISDAIQGKSFPNHNSKISLFEIRDNFTGIDFNGIEFDRISYLFVLSLAFLLLILINGYFKYLINMRKGALGERLLQKLRFDLFSSLLSSSPEQRQRLKPSEAASIIKDEVEPIGGFVGDAFIQPVFLGGQALTALVFILMQNMLLGLIAVLMVGSQAVIIPRLRREQIRLGRQRQIASRALAGKIGEVVETLDEVSNHGTAAVERGQVARRLETLFGIRYRLYGRKFAVKALNNLLAQFTPFLFYTVGGYAALTGNLGIGQLVAVIAAYRDLPPPVKDLIDWDQQRLDVEAKFQQVTEQFALAAPSARAIAAGAAPPDEAFPATGTIVAQGLTVVSATGDRMLDRLSLTLPLARHIALAGPGDGAGCLARILGGRILPSEGSMKIGDTPIGAVPDDIRGRCIAYAGQEAAVFDGTLRDNIIYGLRRADADRSSSTGWVIDAEAAGAHDGDSLEARLVAVLRIVGLADTVFRYGLASRPDADDVPALTARLADIRIGIRKALAARGVPDAVEPYDPARYIRTATIGENILFGVPRDLGTGGVHPSEHDLARQVLDDLGLTDELATIGQRIAATMLEIFADVTPDHLLLERFSFIGADEFPAYRERLARVEAGHRDEADRACFVALSLLYVEPLHRLGLIGTELEERILLAREAFRQHGSRDATRIIDFYDSSTWAAVSVRDNLLFGRVSQGGGGLRERVDEAIHHAMAEIGLDHAIYRIGLEQPAGYGGRLLFPAVKAQVALARSLIKRPSLLILDNALSSLSPTEARAVLGRIRDAMKERTLIVVTRDLDPDMAMDVSIVFEGPRLSVAPGQPIALSSEPLEEGAGSDRDDVGALRAIPIFANLDLARLKLLAFTAERTELAAGELLFEQGGESDAAYVVIAGSADVLIGPSGKSVRVSGIQAPAIIGEMGVVTGEVRSASIRTTSEMTVLKLHKEIFLALMEEFPDLALSVMRLMVRRLQDNVAAVSGYDVPGASSRD